MKLITEAAENPYFKRQRENGFSLGSITWRKVTSVLLTDGWHATKDFELVTIDEGIKGQYAQWEEVGGDFHRCQFTVPIGTIQAFAELPFEE